jgi:SAM-dependent methyltransferase
MGQYGFQHLPDLRVCDFGSGRGLYTRFMIKYAHPDNIYGMDADSEMLEKCRKSFGMCNFLKLSHSPPSPIRECFFDLLLGNSVFSKSTPEHADAWIGDFARIMRPGGLVLITTQGRSFIEYCRQIRESGDGSDPFFQYLSRSFVDTDQSFKDYDSGKYLSSESTEDTRFGETLIPPQYAAEKWCADFELVQFIEDINFFRKALIVLRRK